MVVLTQENIFYIKSIDDFKENLYGFLQQDALETLYVFILRYLGKGIIIDLIDMCNYVFTTSDNSLDIDCYKIKTKYGRTLNIMKSYVDKVKNSQDEYRKKLNDMSITVV